MRHILAFLALTLCAAQLDAGEGVLPVCEFPPGEPMPADTLDLHLDDPDYAAVPGHYIVLLFPEADVDQVIAAVDAQPSYVYRLSQDGEGISGFAGPLDMTQITQLQAMPEVELIEADGEVTFDESQQANVTWGLDRVDQRHLPLSEDYWYYLDLNTSPVTSGTTTHTYIIDTGISYAHAEFTGRLALAPGQFYDACAFGSGNDSHGHGTHVAGTAAGSTLGVAKDTTLHSVRVVNCLGRSTYATVIAGINWVTSAHIKPAVANISMGAARNWILNRALNRSVRAGVFYAVSAGNFGRDACTHSPASANRAFTAAASDLTDTRPAFSNFGRCVNIFAPGVDITSAWISHPTASNTLQGTSMASPHVAGAAALYLSIYPWASPAQVAAALVSAATRGVIQNPGARSPNLLLHSKANSRQTSYSGWLSGFTTALEPMGVPIYSPTSGAHEGQASSPSGAILTLRLKQLQSLSGWTTVATATGITPHVLVHVGAGTYSWEVFNPASPGSVPIAYSLSMSQP